MAPTRQPADGPEPMYTIEEASAYLRISTRTIRRLMGIAEFPRPYVFASGVRLWTREDLDNWVYRCKNRHRFRPAKKMAKDGQERANPGQSRPSAKRPPSDT